MSSPTPARGYKPLIPDYKWSRHSEEIADRNSSGSNRSRPLSRELGYDGFPTTAEGWAASQQEATERTGRTKHRPIRSIDVLDYASLRSSQELSTRPVTSQRLGNGITQADAAVPASSAANHTEAAASRISIHTSAGVPSERPVSRGDRLRHYASSLAHWPGHDQQPLFDPAQSRHKTNISHSREKGSGSQIGPTQRPSTSHMHSPQQQQQGTAISHDATRTNRRFRSQSLDAKRSLHFDKQRQPAPPSLAIAQNRPATRAIAPARPNTSRPTSRADVIVPARSSSLGPQQPIVRKRIPSSTTSSSNNHASSDASVDPQTADQAAKAGINLLNTTQTHQHTSVAPAVTHETVRPQVHEIRRERITRDIHNTHIVHRVLPIKHTEHLPARHFVRTPSENGLQEVQEGDVPSILGFA